MSDLVGNPEDRFSRVAAHMIIMCFVILKLCVTMQRQYIEDIQVFGVNMSFISLSEVKKFCIS